MLRRCSPSLGVHNLWKVVDPYKLPHQGGLRKLRSRFFSDQTSNTNPENNKSALPSPPLRVGVDGNNILHSLVRQTDLVKLLIHDNPEELVQSCLIWAKRSNTAVLFGDDAQRFKPLSLSSLPDFSTTSRQQTTTQSAPLSSSSSFQPQRQKDEGSTVIASFNPRDNNPNQHQNFPTENSSGHRNRLLLNDPTTSGLLFVFDGETPPSKVHLRRDRYKRRERAIAEASVLASYGEHTLANKILQQYPSILPKHILAVAETLSRAGFPVLHAPYESEAQLSYLAENGYVNAVMSSDSDCLVFHAPSTVLRMRNVMEFDMYDLSKKRGESRFLDPMKSSINEPNSMMPPQNNNINNNNDNNNRTSAPSSNNNNNPSTNNFQYLQQQNMLSAQREIFTKEQQRVLDDFVHNSSREIFAFCCISSGSDYNSGAGESLPGNALSIYQNLISQYPNMSGSQGAAGGGRRYGLDLFAANQHQNQNQGISNQYNTTNNHGNKLETTRDACRRLLLHDDLALSLCRAVYSILQHIVYCPKRQKIVTFLPPESVLDLRHYLQELLMKKKKNSNAMAMMSTSFDNDTNNSFELVDSEILGPRTPALATVSDREWCEGVGGAQYRAAMFDHLKSQKSSTAKNISTMKQHVTTAGQNNSQNHHHHQTTTSIRNPFDGDRNGRSNLASINSNTTSTLANLIAARDAANRQNNSSSYSSTSTSSSSLHHQSSNNRINSLSSNDNNNKKPCHHQNADSMLFRDEEQDFDLRQDAESAAMKSYQHNIMNNENDNHNQQGQQGFSNNFFGSSSGGLFRCSVCNVTFFSVAEIEAHMSTKRHEARTKIQNLIGMRR